MKQVGTVTVPRGSIPLRAQDRAMTGGRAVAGRRAARLQRRRRPIWPRGRLPSPVPPDLAAPFGLYLHFRSARRACHYCAFYFVVGRADARRRSRRRAGRGDRSSRGGPTLRGPAPPLDLLLAAGRRACWMPATWHASSTRRRPRSRSWTMSRISLESNPDGLEGSGCAASERRARTGSRSAGVAARGGPARPHAHARRGGQCAGTPAGARGGLRECRGGSHLSEDRGRPRRIGAKPRKRRRWGRASERLRADIRGRHAAHASLSARAASSRPTWTRAPSYVRSDRRCACAARRPPLRDLELRAGRPRDAGTIFRAGLRRRHARRGCERRVACHERALDERGGSG